MKVLMGNLGGMIMCLCEILVGVLLMVNPVGFTSGIIIGVGVILTVAGILNILRYFRMAPAIAAQQQSLAKGMICVLAGLFCVIHSHWFLATFPLLTILYGIAILVIGIHKIQVTLDCLRIGAGGVLFVGISAVLSVIFAVIILANPFGSTAFIWNFVAVSLIVEAVLDMLSMIFT